MENISRPLYNHIKMKLSRKQKLSLSDTIVLLVEVRRFIEVNKLSDKYRVAKFICDWALHSESSRSDNSQEALNVINRRLRDPNMPYENLNLYMQTILDALQYDKIGKQIGSIVVMMTNTPFTLDNYFMFSILKCLIGIPLLPNQHYEENRREIDDQISGEVQKLKHRRPHAIISNTLIAKEAQQRITNFMFTDVRNDGTIGVQVQREDGSWKYGYLQIGKSSSPKQLLSPYTES